MNTINLGLCYLGYFIAYASHIGYKSVALAMKVGSPYTPVIFNGYAVAIVLFSIIFFFHYQPYYLNKVEDF